MGQQVHWAVVYGRISKETNDTQWDGCKSCEVPTMTHTETINGVDLMILQPIDLGIITNDVE